MTTSTAKSTKSRSGIRAARRAAAALLVVGAGVVAAVPAGATSERMQLQCTSGTLTGHTIERSNGSSWWDTGTGTVYTTTSLTVSGDEGVVHHKDYGQKSGPQETCTGQHFGWTWDVELAEAGR